MPVYAGLDLSAHKNVPEADMLRSGLSSCAARSLSKNSAYVSRSRESA